MNLQMCMCVYCNIIEMTKVARIMLYHLEYDTYVAIKDDVLAIIFRVFAC